MEPRDRRLLVVIAISTAVLAAVVVAWVLFVVVYLIARNV